ncbi:general negative regulator of transcription subunit 5 [Polyrhizophydium stewartii]|uniref:General negative regulator of transcription subunit n=1 Tax=Polyrhizophydium stewartii TaxID=2732419 RepID=A0ABR4NBB3_9FUNG
MSARKLQAEIERTIKKVAEGVEVFESIFEKITTATNQAQKEKFEGDLKKEIKKLQRYRDQIKTWAASNEIKDKRVLLENRKLIEQQMEKFKAMEKELKTKAYSQAGLNAANRIDPQEKEKDDLRQWISEMGDKLSAQIDMLEAEQETLLLAVRKTKKADSSKSERLAKIEKQIDRHKHHQTTLEIVLRMMDNGNLKPEEVSSVKDDVTYYVEFNQEPDFEEDEGIYDDLNLEEAEAYGFANEDEETDSESNDDTPPPASHAKEAHSKAHAKGKDEEADAKRKGSRSDHDAQLSSPSKTKQAASSRNAPAHKDDKAAATAKQPAPARAAPNRTNSVSSNGPVPAEAPAPLTQKYAAAAAASAAPAAAPEPSAKHGKAAEPKGFAAAAQAASSASTSSSAQPDGAPAKQRAPSPPSQPPAASSASPQQSAQSAQSQQPASASASAQAHAQKAGENAHLGKTSPSRHPQQQSPDQSNKDTSRDQPSSAATSATSVTPTGAPAPASSTTTPAPSLPATPMRDEPAAQQTPVEPIDNRLPPSLADLVSSFEATKERSQRASDNAYLLQMMDASYQNQPDVNDSGKSKQYLPKDPFPVPMYYPQTPLPLFEANPALVERYGVDTLFFIFYYRVGTYQQLLAARELKRQSWRFHKKYRTWFQRYEEPKSATDEYEQGTYVYFDYEDAWCQRKKADFRFEYKFLEDEIQLH